MIESLNMFIQRTVNNKSVRHLALALAVSALVLLYSGVAPDYLRVAVAEKYAGLAFILYSIWLALAVTFFTSWMRLFTHEPD
jgi:hypothetical protein